MKKLLTIIVLALLQASMFAQGLRFGVKAGYNLLNHTVNKDLLDKSNLTGFYIGPTLDVGLPALPFNVDISALYTQQNIDTNNSNYSVEKTYSLDVPVNLKYTIGLGGLGVVLSAGPYIRFNLDGGNIDFKEINRTYQAKTFQGGANFGVGVNLSKNFYAGITYYTSLTDNYKESDVAFEQAFHKKPDRMAITASYYF